MFDFTFCYASAKKATKVAESRPKSISIIVLLFYYISILLLLVETPDIAFAGHRIFLPFFFVCVNKRTRREFLSFVLRTVYFTLLGIGFMMMTMMRQKKTAGLAKDDEDVRVQSTNDEATGARACVCVVYFLFLDFFYPLLNVIAFSN